MGSESPFLRGTQQNEEEAERVQEEHEGEVPSMQCAPLPSLPFLLFCVFPSGVGVRVGGMWGGSCKHGESSPPVY